MEIHFGKKFFSRLSKWSWLRCDSMLLNAHILTKRWKFCGHWTANMWVWSVRWKLTSSMLLAMTDSSSSSFFLSHTLSPAGWKNMEMNGTQKAQTVLFMCVLCYGCGSEMLSLSWRDVYACLLFDLTTMNIHLKSTFWLRWFVEIDDFGVPPLRYLDIRHHLRKIRLRCSYQLKKFLEILAFTHLLCNQTFVIHKKDDIFINIIVFMNSL